MASWFEDNEQFLEGKSWDEIMQLMAVGTLPEGWEDETEKLIRTLRMRQSETLEQYFDRGIALHKIIKRFGRINDLNLAQYLVWGGPKAFISAVKQEKLLLV